MKRIDEYRQRKENGLSNKEFLAKYAEKFKDKDAIIIIGIDDTGSEYSFIGEKRLEMIGALEAAKFSVTHNSIEWEE